ncbi:MAG TPA: cysteine desulfurase NifS [Candidatus Eremiobacteraeota bacterium]|nr:MAG: Cysteine desulfurase [bacterium ADurb.Bin363]HPZ06557.1 cysteine desulfurase NifS [Candidatus Eremiobacteraeota bacterium]
MKVVYVDNNATTKVAEEVKKEMLPYYTELYGNPSSMHTFGGKVAKKIEEAREKVAELLGAIPSEIVFTSCGTESDNAAIMGTLECYPEKKHIITSRVEHPAVMTLCKNLQKRGYKVTFLPVDNKGRLDLNQLRDSITTDTAIVSLMYANNETGVIFPVKEIATIVKSRGSVFHTDAVQATGKLDIDMKQNNIDFLSLSGHKLHAPKGIGVLYIRRGTKFRPFLKGGHQENSRRGGTENVPSIAGLGKACELAKKNIKEEQERVKKLRDRLEEGILKAIPNVQVNGDRENRLPNTTSLGFEFVEGEAILLMLDKLGICASSGSACTSGSLEPSHVLRAMGIPFTYAHGSIRFSLSYYNTDEDIDYILEHMPGIISKLREISPFTQYTK